jgi:hypothetical protein
LQPLAALGFWPSVGEGQKDNKNLSIPGPDLACNGFISMLSLGYKESDSILYQLCGARAGLFILSNILIKGDNLEFLS